MNTTEKTSITVETTINAPVEKVWKAWNAPEAIMQWCHASDDWHAPAAKNDLRPQGSFSTTMAAKDGSVSFDFGGVYTTVQENELIEYEMADGRKVSIRFGKRGDQTVVTETFDAEQTHSVEMQRGGWQAILDNFRKYVEAK